MNIFNTMTRTNIEIIKLIHKEEMHIRDIADTLGISPGTVHKLVRMLAGEGVVLERKVKNRSVIILNRESPVLREMKRAMNFNDLINAHAYRKLRKLGRVGVYGSYAQGTDDPESDIDIWVKTDKKEIELRPLFRELEKELGIKVNPLLLTGSRLDSLRKNDPEFCTRLKLTSMGDDLDR